MMMTQIRIEVEDQYYQLLLEEQNNRRNESGKKPTLATIVQEYFINGLQSHLSGFNPVHTDNEEPSNAISSVNQIQQKALELKQLEKELEAKEIRLQTQENNQRLHDAELREREQRLIEQYNEYFEKKDEIGLEKDKMRDNSNANVEQMINTKYLTAENERKEVEIKRLNDSVSFLQDKVLKELSKLDNKPNKNIWVEYILPILPSVIGLIGFFFLNKKISDTNQQLPIQEELEGVYNKLSTDDQANLTARIMDVVNKNVKPSETHKEGVKS